MTGGKRSLLLAAILLVTCCALTLAAEEPQDLTGPNVCLKQEVITSTIMAPVREATQIATKTWCLAIPPRCTSYRTVFKVVYKPQQQQKTEMVKRCCEGYILHSNGTCVPLCMNPCINGRCIAPEKCDCNDGFAGDTCTQKCPASKWGPQCTKDCNCQNGATCDSVSGKCQCEDGWRGEKCDEACPSGQYGTMCLQQCRCENNGLCDPINGACKCQPGFCGPLCQIRCEKGAGGRACDRCQNGARCLGETDDKCTCTAGWMGDVCASPCDDGFWGNNCTKPCKICYNHGKCNAVSGACKCPTGYWGDQCEMQCDPGKWGANCEADCNCENAQTCDPTNGKCHCFRGYKGDRCESRGCPDGLFGQYCNNTCHCSDMTTCHPIDGTCSCKLGWRQNRGNDCAMCCILNGGDPACLKDCGVTSLNWICGPELGGCVCLNDYVGAECRAVGQDGNNAALRSQVTKTDNTGLIVGLCIAVIVVILILALALFYRRRVRKLQNELASVTYSSGTDSESDTKSELNHADNMLYLGGGSSMGGSSGGKTSTTVVMKNGETFVKVAEPLPKKPMQNTYVSMPHQNFDDRDSIYQSIEYEAPTPRHQYASIEETAPSAAGQSNQAFENQLYNQDGGQTLGFAPPSYQAVISETMSSTHPLSK